MPGAEEQCKRTVFILSLFKLNQRIPFFLVTDICNDYPPAGTGIRIQIGPLPFTGRLGQGDKLDQRIRLPDPGGIFRLSVQLLDGGCKGLDAGR